MGKWCPSASSHIHYSDTFNYLIVVLAIKVTPATLISLRSFRIILQKMMGNN